MVKTLLTMPTPIVSGPKTITSGSKTPPPPNSPKAILEDSTRVLTPYDHTQGVIIRTKPTNPTSPTKQSNDTPSTPMESVRSNMSSTKRTHEPSSPPKRTLYQRLLAGPNLYPQSPPSHSLTAPTSPSGHPQLNSTPRRSQRDKNISKSDILNALTLA